MVSLMSLWLPIVLSAVAVFMVSAVVWMVMPHHKKDFVGIPDESAFINALKGQNVQPGQFTFPYAVDMKAMNEPAMQQRLKEGPVGFLSVIPPGNRMNAQLMQQFIYQLVISIFAAYLAGRTLQANAEYLSVFRITGTAAFLGYAGAMIPNSIWFGWKWSATWKNVADGLVYALITAGLFGWLWPGGS